MIEKLYEIEFMPAEQYRARVIRRTSAGSEVIGTTPNRDHESIVRGLAQELAETDHRGRLKIVLVPIE